MVPLFFLCLFCISLHYSFLSHFNYVNPYTHNLLGLVPQIVDLVFSGSSQVSCALQESSAMILMLLLIMMCVEGQVIIRVGLPSLSWTL